MQLQIGAHSWAVPQPLDPLKKPWEDTDLACSGNLLKRKRSHCAILTKSTVPLQHIASLTNNPPFLFNVSFEFSADFHDLRLATEMLPYSRKLN